MTTKPTHRKKLQDYSVPLKYKLAALWTSVMFCYVYGDYFSFYVPGKLQQFMEVKTLLNNPLRLFLGSLLMLVPSLMIFISVAARAPINRWLNIVFGIFYTAIMVLIGVTSFKPWWSFYAFLAAAEAVLTSLIVWYAIKWPAE